MTVIGVVGLAVIVCNSNGGGKGGQQRTSAVAVVGGGSGGMEGIVETAAEVWGCCGGWCGVCCRGMGKAV